MTLLNTSSSNSLSALDAHFSDSTSAKGLSRSASLARLESIQEKKGLNEGWQQGVLDRCECLRKANPFPKLHLSFPDNTRVSPLRLAIALNQELEERIDFERHGLETQNQDSPLCSLALDAGQDEISEKIDELMNFFCERFGRAESTESNFGERGRMRQYLLSHSSRDALQKKPLIDVINGLKSYASLLLTVTGDEQKNSLALFPPQSKSEYHCLEGMRQRISAVNKYLAPEESTILKIRPALQLVQDKLMTYMNENAWFQRTSTGNHVHLPNTALNFLGVSDEHLKAIDGYYNSGESDLSADLIYEMQKSISGLLKSELEKDLLVPKNRDSLQSFEKRLNNWVSEGMPEDLWRQIQEHPLASIFTDIDGRQQLSEYLMFATDEDGDAQVEDFVWDWNKIQTEIKAEIQKEHSFLTLEDTGSILGSGSAEDAQESYVDLVQQENLVETIVDKMNSENEDSRLLALSLLLNMSHPSWEDACGPVFVSLVQRLQTEACWTLESRGEEHPLLADKKSVIDERYSSMMQSSSYKNIGHYLLNQKIKMNKSELISDLIYQNAPLYLVKKAVMEKSKVRTLSLPWSKTSFVSKLASHSDAVALIKFTLNQSRFSFGVPSKKRLIENIVLVNRPTVAQKLCQEFNVNPSRLFQWDKEKLPFAALELAINDESKALEMMLAADQVVEKLAAKESGFLSVLESTEISPAVYQVIDKVRWPGKLKDVDAHTPLTEAIKSENYERVRHWVQAYPALLKRHGRSMKTPLHLAVETQNLPITTFLLEQGVDVNAVTYFHKTPLSLAVEKRSHPIMMRLLDAGAKDKGLANGMTPFARIAAYGSISLTNKMLECGFDSQKRWGNIRSAFDVALQWRNDELLHAMFQGGANPNLSFKDGSAHMSYVYQKCNQSILHLFMLHGADLNPAKVNCHRQAGDTVLTPRLIRKYQSFYKKLAPMLQDIRKNEKSISDVANWALRVKSVSSLEFSTILLLLDNAKNQSWLGSVMKNSEPLIAEITRSLVDAYTQSVQDLGVEGKQVHGYNCEEFDA